MAQSLALYRKWRPLTFASVVGQEHITSALCAQVRQERICHAYLFTGTRGTGKTTCAKILARAACCEHPENGEPCNKCPSCLSVLGDSAADFTEIDAASNNGVDNVRDIREEALFSPAALKKRVYIVDEVHMLSASAFNALLKILEEPPAHVLFILATTEVHKIPATILSRCQRFDFRRIPAETIAERLKYIASEEKYSLTDDAARMIAALGDGSMRDSLSLYDRCIPYEGTVDAERVSYSLGIPTGDLVCRLYGHILSGDAAQALALFSELYMSGKDVVTLFDRLLSLIRDIYMVRLTGRADGASGFPAAQVSELAAKGDTARLEYCISCINDLLARVTRTAARRIDGEVCIFRMAQGHSPASAAPVITPAATAKPSPAPAKPEAPKQESTKQEPLKPEAPKPARTPAQPVSSGRLKSDFISGVSLKVNAGVRTYLSLSDISAADGRLKIECPEEALVFMQRENNLAVFRAGAAALGLSDVTVVRKVPQEENDLDSVLKRAHALGIPIERN